MPPAQLLALQLAARGYTAEQIAPLVGQAPLGVPTLLELAAAHLGAPDVTAAIREARRRGLIL